MLITEEKRDATLPEKQDGEGRMATLRCPGCVANNERRRVDSNYRLDHDYQQPVINVECTRVDSGQPYVRLEGLIICTYDGHRRPIRLEENAINETAPNLPSNESVKLSDKVLDGIRQDIEEAETDHFNQSYKSSVVMCRRAVQLSLEAKTRIKHLTLGPLLGEARKQDPPILSEQTDHLAERVHTYGDEGAHRVAKFDPKAVEVVIFDTVVVVNEVFEWQPASPTEQDNNAT